MVDASIFPSGCHTAPSISVPAPLVPSLRAGVAIRRVSIGSKGCAVVEDAGEAAEFFSSDPALGRGDPVLGLGDPEVGLGDPALGLGDAVLVFTNCFLLDFHFSSLA